MKKISWRLWNVDRAAPVGPATTLRKAIANADAMEMRSGEHHTVVPA